MKDDKLQEIIELLPYSIRYSGEIEELLDYAREQAERMVELEEEIKKIRDAYDERLVDIKWYQNMLGIDYEEMSIELPIERVQGEKIKRLEKQNKHYREALEKIAYDDEVLSNTEDIVIAIEALEGEE